MSRRFSFPGITGRLYQQFALTIAISVIFSAFNALSLSPALAALLLKPQGQTHGPLRRFFAWFNRVFGRVTHGYVHWSHGLIRRSVLSLVLLALVAAACGDWRSNLPSSFLPEEDQGYVYVNVQLPNAASMPRTWSIASRWRSPEQHARCQVLHHGAGIQSAEPGANHLQRPVFCHSETVERAQESLRTSRRHPGHINKELAAMPEARPLPFRPRHPGRGHGGRVHLHFGGPRGQGHPVSDREPGRTWLRPPKGRSFPA